jgi:lipoprotein NlpD
MKCFVVLLTGCALLAGCAAPAPAPVSERRGPPPVAARPPVARPAPGTYVVKRGDTLYSIALELGVDYRDLARWNRIEDPSKLRTGQTLRAAPPREEAAAVGGAGVSVGTARGAGMVESRPLDRPVGAPGPSGMRTSPKAVRLPYSAENLALLSGGAPAPGPVAQAPTAAAAATAAVPPAQTPKPPASAEARDADAVEFIWPVKGKVVAGFAEPNSKGLDIAGKLGEPVVAAAPGRVIYTGSGIRGLGKLIVIRHENNFQSVYAHNREILVKEGETVARGQKIAEVGQTDASTPQLHFEIRKSGRPVDPARYLPSS